MGERWKARNWVTWCWTEERYEDVLRPAGVRVISNSNAAMSATPTDLLMQVHAQNK